MLGYRTAGSQIEQVHVKRPKPLRWLRNLFRRLKFKHARFEDGKYGRDCKDVEKWYGDSPLVHADYPDHRWQAVTKHRSRKSRSSQDQTQEERATDLDSIEVSPNRPATYMNIYRKYEESVSRKIYGESLRNVTANLNVDNGRDMSMHGEFSSTVHVDVHHGREGRVTWRDRPKEKARLAVKQVEASVMEQLAGYTPLTATIDNVNPTPLKRNARTNGRQAPPTGTVTNPVRYNIISTPDPPPLPPVTMATRSITQARNEHLKDVEDRNTLNSNFHHSDVNSDVLISSMNQIEHENDNDVNHLRTVKSVRPLGKKPKGRKGKRRKARRKGKYQELLTMPSEENINEEPEDILEFATVKQKVKRKIVSTL